MNANCAGLIRLNTALLAASLATITGLARAEAAEGESAVVSIENDLVRIVLTTDVAGLQFIDKRSGTDYAVHEGGPAFAQVTVRGRAYDASSVSPDGERIRLAFGDSGVSAVLATRVHRRHVVLEVVSVEGQGVELLTFIDLRLTLRGEPAEPFAACAMALNLKTNVSRIPAATDRLQAMCYPRFGFAGAKVALVGCPQAELRDVMKEVVSAADELPHSPIGGPWAMDAEINRQSYMMDLQAAVSEDKIDEWIKLAGNVGIKQLDFHTGRSLRFGDYEPDPTIFPNGKAGVKAVIDKLHAAGMKAGLHTYAFFIAKHAPWVTPVPDPRLGKFRTLTLAGDVTTEGKTIPVVESTADISPVTGFFLRNSATVQIDNELIVFKGAAKESPYAFTECDRGALGTKVAAHAKGAKVHHLKECFGLFVPDSESTLFTEVIERTAAAYNECGFDMIYLDALDGSDIHAGSENAWYYGSKFVFELARRLNKPALFEMSTFHHHLWYVRSRMGAWDVPARGPKRFIDMHTIANEGCRRMFLPSHLGWWGAFTWHPLQPERTFPDDIEYLCGKCIGHDSSLSLLGGFSPKDYAESYNTRRLGAIVKQYEQLRLSNYFPDAVKEKLRVRGDEFSLEQGPGDRWQLRRVRYDEHKVSGLDGRTDTWTVENSFDAQPLRVRIEALMAVEPYDSPGGVTVAEFNSVAAFSERQSKPGVSSELQTVSSPVKVGQASARFAAASTHDQPDGAWTTHGMKLSPCANLADKGLGVWVHGDGQGELLNLQVQGPQHRFGGAACDRYVKVDFNGWRYIELVEPETEHILDYDWPYSARKSDWLKKPGVMGYAYPVFHFWVAYDEIESLHLWLNNLPTGKPVECFLSPIKALPLKKVKIVNPAITLGDRRLVFPTELESGSYIEFTSLDDCKVYDAKGEPIGQVKPRGDVPQLERGANPLRFSCDAPTDASPRANVTVIARGEVIS